MSAPTPAIGFYHLTRDTVEAALPKLLERALREGHKVLVWAADENQVDRLDAALWSYDKESFLPHGTDRNDAQDLQPILLTAQPATVSAPPNGATVLVLIGTALPADVAPFARIVYMFDGHDEAQLSTARSCWKELKTSGLALTYWQQGDAGGWKKAAEA